MWDTFGNWFSENTNVIINASRQFFISGIVLFILKAIESFISNSKRDKIICYIAAGVFIFSGIIYFASTKMAEIVVRIHVERESGRENNKKIYTDCTQTKIYLDGVYKGKTPMNLKTIVGKHWLHVRYEDNPFFEEFGPGEVVFEKRDNKFHRKIDKKRGRLVIFVPLEANGVAQFKITGENLKIETQSTCIPKLPFGRYLIEGKWDVEKDYYHIVVISREDNYAFLFEKNL